MIPCVWASPAKAKTRVCVRYVYLAVWASGGSAMGYNVTTFKARGRDSGMRP